MPTSATTKSLIAGAMLAVAAFATPALAIQHPAFANVSFDVTSIPVGASEFCATRPGECGVNANPVETMTLTEDRWAQLVTINSTLNTTITPVTDQELYQVAEYWTYPDSGYGDCEDIALAKRRDLITQGWQPSTLLMTVARQTNGEGHAVLMVRTDRGDLILDNQDSTIRLWNETPYHLLKRQSQANSSQWVDIADDRPIIIASAQ
jgi:predicted transglutaminase-like cysteine proteinase